MLEGELGAAGHPEHVRLDDRHAREEPAEVRGDQVLEGHEPDLAIGVSR